MEIRFGGVTGYVSAMDGIQNKAVLPGWGAKVDPTGRSAAAVRSSLPSSRSSAPRPPSQRDQVLAVKRRLELTEIREALAATSWRDEHARYAALINRMQAQRRA